MKFEEWWLSASVGLSKDGWWNLDQLKAAAELAWDAVFSGTESEKCYRIEDTDCWCYTNCCCRWYNILRPDGKLFVDVDSLDDAVEITRAMNIMNGFGDKAEYTKTREKMLDLL